LLGGDGLVENALIFLSHSAFNTSQLTGFLDSGDLANAIYQIIG
jgi:hypothetical protein